MKQIDYQMLVKYVDNSSAWVEDNGALVKDNVTIAQHAQATIERYNKYRKPEITKECMFVVARKLPAKYIIKIDEY